MLGPSLKSYKSFWQGSEGVGFCWGELRSRNCYRVQATRTGNELMGASKCGNCFASVGAAHGSCYTLGWKDKACGLFQQWPEDLCFCWAQVKGCRNCQGQETRLILRQRLKSKNPLVLRPKGLSMCRTQVSRSRNVWPGSEDLGMCRALDSRYRNHWGPGHNVRPSAGHKSKGPETGSTCITRPRPQDPRTAGVLVVRTSLLLGLGLKFEVQGPSKKIWVSAGLKIRELLASSHENQLSVRQGVEGSGTVTTQGRKPWFTEHGGKF